MKKIASVSYSPTGSSAIIANQVAETIKVALKGEKPVQNISLNHYTDDKPIAFDDAIVVVSAPVYGGRVAELGIARLEKLQATNSIAIPIVLYGNRAYGDALLELTDLLEEKGFQIAAAGAFIGEHSFSRLEMPIAPGRPDDADIERAEEFGLAIAKKIAQSNDGKFARPAIKGNKPYKVKGAGKPQAPECDKTVCVSCGNCAKVCPAGAITMKRAEGAKRSHPSFNPQLCTQCCACLKGCPANAITFFTPYTEKLFNSCKERLEPEWSL